MTRFEALIPTIPHRHEKLCALLAEFDRQMQPGAGVLVYQDNLETGYGEKCGALVRGSTADYVAFFDDDDWPAPDYFERVLTALEENPDYVGCPATYTNNGNLMGTVVLSLRDRSAEYANPFSVSGIAHKNPIRRELALRGTWAGGYGADARWADEVHSTGCVQTEAWISEPLYEYRWSSGDEFNTQRQPMPGPLPELPERSWLRML